MNFFIRIGWCLHIAWRMPRVIVQMMWGTWRISKLNTPVVSIFGGSRFLQNDPYAVQAHQLAQMFVSSDISVLTGGGPGIMEAASCGAILHEGNVGKGSSIGISVPGLEGRNPCVAEYFEIHYLFARKYLLTHFSQAFVVFPGGFGTLDELAEVLTLIKTIKMPRLPIVLIGVEYWTPFIAWLKDQVLKHAAISQADLEIFVLTDDLNRAFSLACATCKLASDDNQSK